MRLFLCITVLLVTTAPACLAEGGKPGPLSAKEAADGWLALFDGETSFGWNVDGDSKVTEGVLVLGNGKATVASPTTAFSDFKMRVESKGVANLVLDTGNGKSSLGLTDQDSVLTLDVEPKTTTGQGLMTVTQTGNDGVRRSEATYIYDRSCVLAIRFEVDKGHELLVRKILLRPLALKPIFNGKDLQGWKKFTADEKRAKTEFSVTSDGLLHLKNGPGDLQTESQYGDFVLQAECKTNGTRLNSGVFFRCIPGEYQNGYEAQIHNGFDAEKPKEYTVEEYDPKTNELKNKKKVKYTAIDYGTGAIYRRIPARSQAAKDNEWFTMTVAAQGRHITTWVNGVQTVDWTDNRPLKDNARNGCRLEPGPISLQGHDPTTDIDFRNIRIVELPKPQEKR